MGGTGDLGIAEFLRELAAPTPAPGAGGALAITVAMAAGLVEMTARISAERASGELSDERLLAIAARANELGAEATDLGDADAEAYGAVLEAMHMDQADAGRAAAVADALSAAAEPPLRISELAAQIAELAAEVVAGGRASVRGDAIAGALLAEAGCRGAARLVEIDVESASDRRPSKAVDHASRAAVARSQALRS
jgi:formiminotetrahydrofolate cyclodeaminase